MKKLICVCCGAPINRLKQKCEYCGTEYIIEDERPVIKFETYTNPVREFKACAVVPDEYLAKGGEEIMEIAIHELAKKMLPAVVQGMQIRTKHDPFLMSQRIDGRIRIVIPVKDDTGWQQ